MTKPPCPTIHLNGTSKRALLDQLSAAYSELSSASALLRVAMPHDRDYYPQGDGAGHAAREHRSSQIEAVQRVMRELEAEAISIQAQPGRED